MTPVLLVPGDRLAQAGPEVGPGAEAELALGAGHVQAAAGLAIRLRGVELDPTKPNGQPRRCLDVSRAEQEFGFRARTDFRTGLRQTIAWYEQHRRVDRSQESVVSR